MATCPISRYKGGSHLITLLVSSSVGVLLPLCCLDWSVLTTASAAFAVAATICYANVVEYFVHRFLYHELTGLKKFRKYHAIVHHGFFSTSNWKIESADDIFFVLFPSWVYIGWALLGAGSVLCGVCICSADPLPSLDAAACCMLHAAAAALWLLSRRYVKGKGV